MTSSQFAIETKGLRKSFGNKVAVRNLSLTVRRGEIFGFLGPNGAGKSTSIRMLLGLASPTGGSASVLGRPAGEIAVRRRIGFLPEDFRFYEWLTASELLRLHGRLCGVSANDLRQRIPLLIDLVGLTPHRDKRLEHFSKGMLQRIGLAQALIHQPDLIFLDLHLPDLAGDQVLAGLRSDPRTRTIPVVMISADTTPRQVKRLLDAGAQDYLTKPIDVKKLFAVLDEYRILAGQRVNKQ